MTTLLGKYVSYLVTMGHSIMRLVTSAKVSLKESRLLLSHTPLGCALLCKLCVPSLGCVQCEDNYVLTDNLCVQGEASRDLCMYLL